MNPNWTARDIPSQKGKLAIVTGANVGIGFHTAMELARAGARVILACRSPERGAAAVRQIREGLGSAEIETQPLDLADLSSIHEFAQSFETRNETVDLLVNNAGVMAVPKRHTTKDGFELQFGTNHLGHFALTGFLLPALLRSEAPRVVTVSSIAHRRGVIAMDNLHGEQRYNDLAAYNNSKLANLLFAFELHRRARQASVPLASIAAHPGVATTNLFAAGSHLDKQPLFSWLTEKFVPLLGQSDAQGAWAILYAATAPEATSGEFYGPNRFFEFKGHPVRSTPSATAKDPAIATALWEASEQMTGVKYAALAQSAMPVTSQ